jgi:hypothetical protein
VKRELCFFVFCLVAAVLPLAAQNADVSLVWKTEGNRPFAVAFDGQGSMYVVTAPPTGNGLLSRIAPDGAAGAVAVLEGGFIGPGIDIDDDGLVFVTVDRKGGVRTVADGFTRCIDVKLDHHGNAYVADDLKDTVYRVSLKGKKEVLYQGGKSGAFILTGLAFDRAHETLYLRGNRRQESRERRFNSRLGRRERTRPALSGHPV